MLLKAVLFISILVVSSLSESVKRENPTQDSQLKLPVEQTKRLSPHSSSETSRFPGESRSDNGYGKSRWLGDWRPLPPSPPVAWFQYREPSGILIPPPDLDPLNARVDPSSGSYSNHRFGVPLPLPNPSLTLPFWEENLRRQKLLSGYHYEKDFSGAGCRHGRFHTHHRFRGTLHPDVEIFREDVEGFPPHRLGAYGVGAYGLFGWSQPEHHHNTIPLGAGRGLGHDNPN